MFFVLYFVFLSLSNSYATIRFPYAKSLNISETKVESFSKYFCSLKQGEKKCCNCRYSQIMGDVCIDFYAWKRRVFYDLDEYLNESYSRLKLQHEEVGETCQPILNHISPSSGHLVEHLSVLSYYFMDYSNITDCVDYKKIQFKEEFNFMVYGEHTGLFYNKECISWLQKHDKTSRTRHIPIKVYCIRTNNLTLDMVFTVRSLNLLEECIFVVDTFNDTYLEVEKDMYQCVHLKGFCEKGNPYHDLCYTYQAPIGGYRNIHCALCDNQTWDHYDKVEQCTDCEGGLCDLRKRVDRITYPISFSLIPDEEGTEYRVKNITTAFPIKEFFGIKTDVALNFKVLLCNQSKDSCCSCRRNCMKYNTCCMDVMWNPIFPLEMEEYKKQLIRQASEYIPYECVPLISLVKEKTKKYHMITKCFTSFNTSSSNQEEEEEKRCLHRDSSDIKSIIPVLDVDGYLYRNIYCAYCNDVSDYKPINLTCFSHTNDTFDIKDCTFEIDMANNQIDLDIVEECFDDSSDNTQCEPDNVNFDLCNAYEGNIGAYKNFHCYLCQNASSSIPVVKKCNRRNDPGGIKTFITFEMNTLRVLAIEPPKEHMCETDDIFELFGDRCRRRKIRLLTDHEFDRCMDKRNIALFAKVTTKNEIRSFPKWILNLNSNFDYLSEVYMNNSDHIIYRIMGSKKTRTNDFISHYVDSLKMSLKLKEVDHFMISPTKEPVISKEYSLDVGSTFPNKRICYKMKTLSRDEISFTNSCQISFGNNSFFNITEVNMWITFDQFSVSRFIALCEHFFMEPNNCPLKTIKTDNLTVGLNRTITYNESGELVQKTFSRYAPIMGGVVVCEPIFVSEMLLWIRRINQYTIIASLTGKSLNLIFHITIIHALLPIESLRGHMALTLSLFLLDACYIFSVVLVEFLYLEKFLLCKIIAIVTHFAFIMVQVWCVMCCFDVWSNFEKSFGQFNRFRYHVKQSLSITFSVIISGFFMDYLGFVSLGYNNNETCVSHPFIGRLCFFVIPMVLSVISSICLMSRLIACNLLKKKDENQDESKKKKIQLVYLTIKIVLVVELVEIMSFVKEFNTQGGEEDLLSSIIGLSYGLMSGARGAITCYVHYNAKTKMNNIKNKLQFTSSKTLSVTQNAISNEESCL